MATIAPTGIPQNHQPPMFPQTIQTSQCEPVTQVGVYQADARTQLLQPTGGDVSLNNGGGCSILYQQGRPGSPPPVAQGTSVVAVMQLQVSVPSGAAPGQAVQFTAPDGRLMSATVPEGVAPGSVLTVQYPMNNQSPAPAPAVQPATMTAQVAPRLPQVGASVEEQDAQASAWGWRMYAAGLVCLCCQPFCSFILWLVAAGLYFCKPQSARSNFPRQRGPAMASLITGIILTVIAMLMFLVGLAVFAECGDEFKHCPGIAARIRHMEKRTDHMNNEMDRFFAPRRPSHDKPEWLAFSPLEQQETSKQGLDGFLQKALEKPGRQPEMLAEPLPSVPKLQAAAEDNRYPQFMEWASTAKDASFKKFDEAFKKFDKKFDEARAMFDKADPKAPNMLQPLMKTVTQRPGVPSFEKCNDDLGVFTFNVGSTTVDPDPITKGSTINFHLAGGFSASTSTFSGTAPHSGTRTITMARLTFPTTASPFLGMSQPSPLMAIMPSP